VKRTSDSSLQIAKVLVEGSIDNRQGSHGRCCFWPLRYSIATAPPGGKRTGVLPDFFAGAHAMVTRAGPADARCATVSDLLPVCHTRHAAGVNSAAIERRFNFGEWGAAPSIDLM
jgi:hypothetical protein